jgi:hypothetical protein
MKLVPAANGRNVIAAVVFVFQTGIGMEIWWS